MRCRRMKSGGSSYPVSAGRRKPRRQTVDCCRRRWYDGRTGWRCGDGRHNGTDRADRGIWNVRPALSRPCGHCRDGRRFCVGNKMVARARARRQAGRKGGAPRARRRSKADDMLGRRHHARRAAHVVVSCALYLRHLRQTVPVYISGTGIPAPPPSGCIISTIRAGLSAGNGSGAPRPTSCSCSSRSQPERASCACCTDARRAERTEYAVIPLPQGHRLNARPCQRSAGAGPLLPPPGCPCAALSPPPGRAGSRGRSYCTPFG